jgi:hypothetical protein
VLVLLMRGIYDVHQCDGLCHDIHIPSFIKIGIGVQAILRLSQKFERLQCWYY